MNKMLDKNRQMKDSEIEWIGKIPKEWELKNMKYFIKYKKGKTPNSLNSEKVGIPYIGASDLEDNKFLYHNYTTELLTTCNKEDVLVLWDGARAGLIGYGHEGIIASTIVSISTVNHKLLSQFLFYLLKGFQTHLISLTNGTTIPHMSRSFINELGLPLPYLYEQQAIANYLDEQVLKIDELIAEQNKAIENWNTYKQSLITEKVTKGLNPSVEMKESGIEWIGGIPKEWKFVALSEFIDFINGFAFDSGDLILDGDVSVIRISDIQNGTINYESCLKTNNNNFGKSYIKNKDILLVMSGGTTGKTAFVEQINQIIATNQRVGIIRLKQNNPKYVYYCLNSKNFKEYIDLLSMGSAQPNISTKSMKTYKITLPPLHEQQAIANYLDEKYSKIDQIIKQKKGLIEQLEEYKRSLIYECVTGKQKIKE